MKYYSDELQQATGGIIDGRTGCLYVCAFVCYVKLDSLCFGVFKACAWVPGFPDSNHLVGSGTEGGSDFVMSLYVM